MARSLVRSPSCSSSLSYVRLFLSHRSFSLNPDPNFNTGRSISLSATCYQSRNETSSKVMLKDMDFPELEENKLCVPWETKSFIDRKFHSSITGQIPLFRYMTTAVCHEPSSGEITDTVSPDIDQPHRIKFKRLDKTAKNIMNILDKEAVDKVQADREIPDIKPGYIIQLKVEVPENKRRVSILKGIVIARRNAGINTTFRLRRLVASVGVESVFPLYSPNIKEMKVLDKKKVRRAKLYYLRDKMNALKK